MEQSPTLGRGIDGTRVIRVAAIVATAVAIAVSTATPALAHVEEGGVTGRHSDGVIWCDYGSQTNGYPKVYANTAYANGQRVAFMGVLERYENGRWREIWRSDWDYWWVYPYGTTTHLTAAKNQLASGYWYRMWHLTYWQNPVTGAWEGWDWSLARDRLTGSTACYVPGLSVRY